jgi:HPt (histidine-containing phosphotransfer) domain-containing protein
MEHQVIYLDLAIRLAGNNRKVASELFTLLLKSLPTEYENIKTAYKKQQLTDLLNYLHKLHGALNYCGTPKLKKSTLAFESAVKTRSMDALPKRLVEFEEAVHEVLHYSNANLFATHS